MNCHGLLRRVDWRFKFVIAVRISSTNCHFKIPISERSYYVVCSRFKSRRLFSFPP